MRIMFQANAPWCTTGYGVQGKHLVPRLQALGHQMAYFAFYGLQNGMLNINGVPIYPMGTHPWGQDVVQAHMGHFGGEMLISLLDVWVLEGYGKKAQDSGYIWCPWTPVDQEPVPQAVLARLDGAHTVIPYAKHGEAEFRRAGIKNVRYIPHGVATSTFKPLDRTEARRTLRLPEDAFIVGMVAANKGYPPRKCFPEQFMAFRQFKNRHPEAILYLHTLKGTEHGGVNFAELMWRLELVEGRDVIFSDQYTYLLGWAEERMAMLYNAFDFLSLTSSGEGFGIPLIEAQACGIPVVSSHNTAMTELTFAGACVTEQHPFWTPLGAFAMIPDVPAIVGAYEGLYQALQNPEQRMQLAEQARAGALAYDWDRVVAEWWKPFLEELEAERHPATMPIAELVSAH
jgi:glycosyltransferase involved in cell wall biosynthesis